MLDYWEIMIIHTNIRDLEEISNDCFFSKEDKKRDKIEIRRLDKL